MASKPFRLGLTRDQLASFLNDFEQIKQFEKLFQTVDDINIVALDEINVAAGTAIASANEALAEISRIADALDVLVNAPVIENNNSVKTDYIDFDTVIDPPATRVGRIYWNGGTTANLQMTPHVVQRIGENQYFYIKATANITKGQLVMFTGAVGASGVVTGAPSTGITDGQYLIGIAAEDIPNNDFGLVQDFGPLRNVNTAAFADGDILYYDPAIPGGLTNTQPTAPNVKATIAVVTKGGSAGGGSIFIRMSTGSVLGGTDSNVQFGTLVDADIIQYNGTAGYWENVPSSSVQVLSWLGL